MIDYVPWSISKRFLTATGTVRRVYGEFIRKKRAKDANTDSATPPDIISQLIKLGEVSDDLLIEQTLNFLTAGG
ncbi:hypothetical protein ACMFMF_008014 [Clarireedia jacksonii]